MSEVRKGGKYLRFIRDLLQESGKTQRWQVKSKANYLGEIKWYSGWRQYVFYPYRGTLYNYECLDEISKFLFTLNTEHKERRDMERVGGK